MMGDVLTHFSIATEAAGWPMYLACDRCPEWLPEIDTLSLDALVSIARAHEADAHAEAVTPV